MPYYSIHMPIGWEGLSMLTDGCSLHMHLIVTNPKLRSAEQDSFTYIIKAICSHIPAECQVVGPYVYRFHNGSG